MTTNAFRHRPPEQCTLSKEDQQHILHISNNDQELLDELMAILRQLRPLPPRGASVRHTDACHSQGAQGTDREHPQAGSCQTAKDDGGKPGVRFLARSKRGTRFRTASPLGGTRQRRRRFCSPWVGRDQGRRHCRWRSPDDRNWLSFHDRYQLRGQPHPHGLNMLGLNRFQRS